MRAAGEATRQRILTEARKEFAEYGLAGARINRIATKARASKERLYAYFADKDELFDAVCAGVIKSTADEVRFSADDVPGFVGRLFDIYIADPDIVRLYDRISMDGTRDFRSRGGSIYAIKVEELRRGQEAATVDPAWDPTVLLSMLLGIVRLMATEHSLLESSADGRPTLEERRAAAVRAAEKLVRPTTATPETSS
ncbi:putative regulatory protein, TetR family [Planotetraspora thailandica]|uniref:Putative regulatory protein, TetR family n=1 Tax=Planotetraspora thailandica TaxID=487172 RepID=A0A8J3UWL8_9ACTN|nr:TetR family transcriptional regulator [Planotetraspora thailandica]GII52045.1 putative regulatory protein, TetR family [Planotetraspora thailandica]